MEINIEKLVPDDWTVEKVNNQIKVYYSNKGRGNSPKPFTLPRVIRVDKEFMEAIGMYLGDGKLSADDKHLGFASIDKDMAKFILDFFINRFSISLKDVTISIRFKEFKEEVLKNWAEVLNILYYKFKIQTSSRTKNESCDIEISGKVFRILFEKIINQITTSNFIYDKQLRRAFLRGLFAAEGNIGVNYEKNYIVCIRYSLCYNEEYISTMLKKSLDIESITYTESKKMSDKSLTVQITNWKNYYKLWKIDLFHLNTRKEVLFLNKLKLTKFSCKINSELQKRLFFIKHFSQRQLAFLIGTQPSMFSNILNNKRCYINIEYLIHLSKLASVPLQEVKQNLMEFRVNDITPINDREFINFIFDLKSYSC